MAYQKKIESADFLSLLDVSEGRQVEKMANWPVKH